MLVNFRKRHNRKDEYGQLSKAYFYKKLFLIMIILEVVLFQN